MNVKKIYLLTVAVLTSFAACTVDDRISQKDETPIVLTTMMASGSHNVTRAGTALQGAQFGSGETFYAYFPSGVRIGSATSECNTIYTTNGNGGTTSASQPYFSAGASSCNVYAYYPYEASGKQVTNATTSFSVELDQTTDAAYKRSDLMYATVSVTKNNATPSGLLSFNHKMSKIIINVTPGQGIASVSDIRIVGGNKTIALSNDGTCTLGATSNGLSPTGSYISVFSGSHTSGTLSCAALIPPQTITGDFLQVLTPAGTATFSVTDQAFISGQSYEYTINVTAATIGVTTDITDWDNQGTTNLVNYGTTNTQNAPEVVDIGLFVNGATGGKPLLWANMNVGATSETDFGYYFMWGDIIGRSGELGNGTTALDGYSYSWANYKWSKDGSSSIFTKYVRTEDTSNWGGSGSPDNKSVLDISDDAARAHWGGSWRIPTLGERNALKNTYNPEDWGEDNTTNWKWEWQTNYKGSGHNGYLISYRANTSNTIVTSTLFLPAAGYRNGTSVNQQGSEGWYLTTMGSGSTHMYNLRIDNSSVGAAYNQPRYYGQSVRPVQEGVAPALGDPYYSDGTWGNNPHAANATVIGVVAWLGSGSDLKCGKIHGLVMAKSDVSSTQTWGPTSTDESFLTNTSSIDGCRNNDKNGLTNTDNLLNDSHTHDAATAARNYTPTAPSTGRNTNWFLPSAAQWLAVMGPDGIGGYTGSFLWCEYASSSTSIITNINSRLTATSVGGTGLKTSSNFYWSSTESNNSGAIVIIFNSTNGVVVNVCTKTSNSPYVRAFLAF